jgi:hypothetical protein
MMMSFFGFDVHTLKFGRWMKVHLFFGHKQDYITTVTHPSLVGSQAASGITFAP